jgi:hypothetical protein
MIRRAPRYDNDPDVITRPDTVPAVLRFAEESSPAIETGAHRELKPYPAVPPPSDEATVVYALSAMQPTPRVVTPLPELRSGTRNSLASTVPPPSRTRRKSEPRVSEFMAEDARFDERPQATPVYMMMSPASVEGPTLAPPAPAPPAPPAPAQGSTLAPPSNTRTTARRAAVAPPTLAPPAFVALEEAPRRGTGRAFLLGALTTIVAALIGAGLGNGSIKDSVERLRGGGVATTAPVSAPRPAKAAAQPPVVVAAPPPAPVPTPEAARVPVVRFQDLTPTQADETQADKDKEDAPSTKTKRKTRPRRR